MGFQSMQNNMPYNLQVSRGLVPNATNVAIEGNTNLLTNTFRQIWDFPTVAVEFENRFVAANDLRIVSDSTGDDPAFGGAHLYFIEGIDQNNDLASEFVTMDGTANVILAIQYKKINEMTLVQAGSNNVNLGNIRVFAQGVANNVMNYIPQFQSSPLQSSFMVPRNHTLFIDSFTMFSHINTDSMLRFRAIGGTGLPFSQEIYLGTIRNDAQIPFGNHTEIPETFVISIQGILGTAGNKKCALRLFGTLIKNS